MFQELEPKEWYSKYTKGRRDHENIAEAISKLTLPYLMRAEGSNDATKYSDTIAQAYCGRLLNTLKAKMGMSLLPPSTSSFRLEPDKDALDIIVGGDADKKAEIYRLISSQTASINKEIEAQQIRDTVFELLLQLSAVGSVVVEKKKGDGIQLHTLRNFAVDLDARGEARGICVVEIKKDLPEGIIPEEEKDEYNLYTLLERNNEDGKWYMRQAIEDYPVGDEATYTDKNLPFQYVGWTWNDGDKYHRPYAEDYLPDMESFNTYSNLIEKASIISSKVVLFVDEKGNRTRKADVANSANGDVVNGRAEDVTALQIQKGNEAKAPQQNKSNNEGWM